MISILEKVFGEINDEKIKYVHFKSNEHLDAALDGKTDLDILVDNADYKKFVHILENNGFSLFRSENKLAYISVFDYLYLDANSMQMIHFHLHTNYITGKKFIKEYLFPIEDYIFENRRVQAGTQIYVINPETELVLLWIRFCLKTGVLRNVLHHNKISTDFIKESEWLLNQYNISNEKIVCEIENILGKNQFNELFGDFICSPQKEKKILRTMLMIKRNSKKFRTENFTEVKYLLRRLGMIFRYLEQKYLNKPIAFRRYRVAGGKIIVLIGADGSGKSSITKDLNKILKKKVDVYNEYFGSGDGKSSIIRKPLIILKKIFIKKKTSSEKEIGIQEKKSIGLKKAVWAIVLATEKKNKLGKIWKAKTNGMIVLCDRFPQTQFYGINDGPLLTLWIGSKSKLKCKIANWELSIYESAKMYQPDIIIKLNVDPDIAIKRKPLDNPDDIRRKVILVRKLFEENDKCLCVDSNRPYVEVLSDVCSKVSEIL